MAYRLEFVLSDCTLEFAQRVVDATIDWVLENDDQAIISGGISFDDYPDPEPEE